MRILLWTSHARAEIIARVKGIAGVDLVVIEDVAALAREAPAAAALICTDFLYTPEVADLVRRTAKQLRWIQLLTAGYDSVVRQGVPPGTIVTNAGDALSPAVAAHAVTLLLALQRHVPFFLANQARQAWDRSVVPQLATPAGNTIAVVGFGSIGREVARLLRPFGGHTVALSRSGTPHPLADEVLPATALPEVLPRVDGIVLTLPLTPDTHHLIGARELASCRRNVVIVNVARGAIVDHEALADALKNGVIAGAGTDVTEPEPLPHGHPLWDAPNFILSPHLAGACGAIGLQRLATVAGDNVERFVKGETLAHQIALA